jgi:copper chaperone
MAGSGRMARRPLPDGTIPEQASRQAGTAMIPFQVSDMTSTRCAGAVTKALKAVDHAALVRVDLATCTVEIEPGRATARQLSDAIKCAGYSPVAA